MRIWGLLRRKNLLVTGDGWLVTGDEWLVTGDGWLVMIWIYCWAKSNKKSSISPDYNLFFGKYANSIPIQLTMDDLFKSLL